jgi:hypothetical protein
MNSSTTSIKSALIGINDIEVAGRKAFLEFAEADAALWIVASGYLLTLAAQDRSARNNGFFLPLRSRPSCP